MRSVGVHNRRQERGVGAGGSTEQLKTEASGTYEIEFMSSTLGLG